MEENHGMPPSPETEVQVSIRLPKELLERAEGLVDALRKNPDNVLLGLTRATVLRLAILRGLDALEAEKGGKR